MTEQQWEATIRAPEFWARYMRATRWFSEHTGLVLSSQESPLFGQRLRLPLVDDYALELSFGAGEALWLVHPSFDTPVHLGKDDGHPMMDALRGVECRALVDV